MSNKRGSSHGKKPSQLFTSLLPSPDIPTEGHLPRFVQSSDTDQTFVSLLYCRQWSDIPLGAHSAVEASDNRRAPLARGNAKMCSFSEM